MAKVLIAEDEQDIRELIKYSLDYAGLEVVAVSNGQELVDTVKAMEIKPDLIISDVRMPQKTGYEACAEIKAMPELQDVPIIFLSAKGQESEIKTGLSSGAYEYILKPFEPNELMKRVTDIISGKTRT